MTENNDTLSMEEQALKESIFSAAGLYSDKLQIGLKGNPSMRESVSMRKRYRSSIDDAIDVIIVNLEDMMLNRGVYRIFAGFNSMVQCTVLMQFNRDGTQVIDAKNLQQFLQENLS